MLIADNIIKLFELQSQRGHSLCSSQCVCSSLQSPSLPSPRPAKHSPPPRRPGREEKTALPSQPALPATCQGSRREICTWSEREVRRKRSRSLPSTGCQLHSWLAAAGRRENPMSARGALEGWQHARQHWKPGSGQGREVVVRNFCTAALCASNVKPRQPEDALSGRSSSMAEASVPALTLNPSASGHHPSPGKARAPGKMSSVILWLLCASTAINQAAMEGINSPSASACEREGKGTNCKQGGPHQILYPSASLTPCLATTLLPFLY